MREKELVFAIYACPAKEVKRVERANCFVAGSSSITLKNIDSLLYVPLSAVYAAVSRLNSGPGVTNHRRMGYSRGSRESRSGPSKGVGDRYNHPAPKGLLMAGEGAGIDLRDLSGVVKAMHAAGRPGHYVLGQAS